MLNTRVKGEEGDTPGYNIKGFLQVPSNSIKQMEGRKGAWSRYSQTKAEDGDGGEDGHQSHIMNMSCGKKQRGKT